MDWPAILAELERKRAFSLEMGGEARLARQYRDGKLDARQRMSALFDGGLFTEIGGLAGNLSADGPVPAPADGLVAGFGLIDGRPALAAAEDFTVLAGSIGDAGAAKRHRIALLARQERVPLVFMLEGAGHRLTNSHGSPAPNDLQALVSLSGVVPMVCLVLGASAGHGALTAPLSDFVVMTKAASLFVAGPPLVKAALGEDVTKEELGGPQVHVVQSGVAHNLTDDDQSAIALARQWLSLVPGNHRPGADSARRALEGIESLIPADPRVPFDIRELAKKLLDEGSMVDVQPAYGASLLTALGRLGGHSVALVANNPAIGAGAIDAAAAQKATRFLRVAGDFGVPVIFLADNPGVLPGTASEKAGALRLAADMFAAQHRLQVPKIHVTVRKAFGFGSSVMAMNPFDGQTLSLTLPSISLGAMPAQSGGQSAGLDAESRARIAVEQSRAAFALADRMVFDNVIAPAELRNALLDSLMLASHRLGKG